MKHRLFVLVFLVTLFSFVSSEEIVFLYPPKNITAFQGENISTSIVIRNDHNETLEWISLNFEKDSKIESSILIMLFLTDLLKTILLKNIKKQQYLKL